MHCLIRIAIIPLAIVRVRDIGGNTLGRQGLQIRLGVVAASAVAFTRGSNKACSLPAPWAWASSTI